MKMQTAIAQLKPEHFVGPFTVNPCNFGNYIRQAQNGDLDWSRYEGGKWHKHKNHNMDARKGSSAHIRAERTRQASHKHDMKWWGLTEEGLKVFNELRAAADPSGAPYMTNLTLPPEVLNAPVNAHQG